MDNLIGSIEPEGRGIPAVQFDNGISFIFESFCLLEKRTANLVADILHLVRFQDLAHILPFLHTFPAMRFIIIRERRGFFK
jgi:hypothetical protein